MTAEQKLDLLARIAAQKPRTGIRTALREVSAKAERYARFEELRACVAARRDAVKMATMAGAGEGIC